MNLVRAESRIVLARFRSRVCMTVVILSTLAMPPLAQAAGSAEALKIAEKFQGGGHANASGAMLPKSIRNINEAVDYLRTVLNPKRGAPLNNLESLFAGIEAEQRK